MAPTLEGPAQTQIQQTPQPTGTPAAGGFEATIVIPAAVQGTPAPMPVPGQQTPVGPQRELVAASPKPTGTILGILAAMGLAGYFINAHYRQQKLQRYIVKAKEYRDGVCPAKAGVFNRK